jgi:hypothetical protein
MRRFLEARDRHRFELLLNDGVAGSFVRFSRSGTTFAFDRNEATPRDTKALRLSQNVFGRNVDLRRR